jgi:hypothetical protein
MNSTNLFPDLVFLDEGRIESSADLSALEDHLGKALPESLRAWLGQHSGSMLDRVNYFISMKKLEGLPCSIGVEYMLSSDEIAATLDQFAEAFPTGYIPFGDDGDGNYLLVADDGSVYFWDWRGRIKHLADEKIDQYTIKVANSLHDFFLKLGRGPLTEMDEREE